MSLWRRRKASDSTSVQAAASIAATGTQQGTLTFGGTGRTSIWYDNKGRFKRLEIVYSHDDEAGPA